MANEILKEDATLARIENLPPEQYRRELSFRENSINGLVSYFKRYGTEYIKTL